MRIFAAALFFSFTFLPIGLLADEPAIDALQQQVEQLKSEIEKLSAIVEGTAKPINLARTDFAAVATSSVNGDRSPDNKYYGVLNAFDDGENWLDGINYTYWLSGGGGGEFIEVRFDHPVTVTSVAVEGLQEGGRPDVRPRCMPLFRFHKGGEEPHAAFGDRFQPKGPLHGVTSLRLTFDKVPGNIRVNEVRVMGYPHPDVKHKVSRPRLILNQREAEAIAKAAFNAAGFSMHSVAHRTMEHMDRWEVVFHHTEDKVDLFRVVVFQQKSRVETKKLAKWAPIGEAK